MAKYTLDVGQRGRQLTIEGLHVGDNGFRIFDFSFSERGKPFPLPDGCIATIYATLPGGVTIYETCTIEDDSALYELRGGTDEPSITAKSGKVNCEIRITDSEGNVITSPKFAFIIDKVLQDDDAIEAQESFSALTDALSKVAEADASYKEAITDANKAIDEAEALEEDLNTALDRVNDAETGLDSKVDKVEGAEGNIVIFDKNGGIADSGVAPSIIYVVDYNATDTSIIEVFNLMIAETRPFSVMIKDSQILLPASGVIHIRGTPFVTAIYRDSSGENNEKKYTITINLTSNTVTRKKENYYTGGGSGGIAEETDPTVPAWAKEPEKPSYSASEVGADAAGTASTKVMTHNTDTDSHNDIRLLIKNLTARFNALANSSDTDLDQLSEIVAYIKSNKSLIDSITTSKVSVSDIINNLTTNVSNKPLSAAQGVALKALIDAIKVPTKISAFANDKGYITQTEMKNYVNETILNGEW